MVRESISPVLSRTIWALPIRGTYVETKTLMKHRIFVYGTLKRGYSRHDLLKGQNFLGEMKTTRNYRLYKCGSFPALVEVPREDVDLPGVEVQGELWEVDDDCLRALDSVEGVDAGLFERRVIRLLGHEGQVEAYIFNGTIEGLEDCGSSWS